MDDILPFCDHSISDDMALSAMRSDRISNIKLFALGPRGTNIEKAAQEWSETNHIASKTEIVLCRTPEEEVLEAMKVKDECTLPIFALCAVYYDLHKLFFSFRDCHFFMCHHYMALDNMQIATRKDVNLVRGARFASHPSPELLANTFTDDVYKSNSNAHAAELCSKGIVEACITTERARHLYTLRKVFDFGSPTMLFTFGTTSHGVRLIDPQYHMHTENLSERRDFGRSQGHNIR